MYNHFKPKINYWIFEKNSVKKFYNSNLMKCNKWHFRAQQNDGTVFKIIAIHNLLHFYWKIATPVLSFKSFILIII